MRHIQTSTVELSKQMFKLSSFLSLPQTHRGPQPTEMD